MTTNDLLRIISAGSGMYVPANILTNDLLRIAEAASEKCVRIIFNDASRMLTNDVLRIAEAGKGCVTFDLSK